MANQFYLRLRSITLVPRRHRGEARVELRRNRPLRSREGGYVGAGLGQAIYEQHALACLGRDLVAGQDDAGEVHGVDGADPDLLAGALGAADTAEGIYGLGQGILLAGWSGDEAAAAHLAPRL